MKTALKTLLTTKVHGVFFALSCALLVGVVLTARTAAVDMAAIADEALEMAATPPPSSLRPVPISISARTAPAEVYPGPD